MNDVLRQWNNLQPVPAVEEILPCCGSRSWAHGMAIRRPIASEASLLAASDAVWLSLAESDWLEAFCSHPRIGESPTPGSLARSASWSGAEQQKIGVASSAALAEANREYERRFHRIFIVCATGKSGPEILEILRRRLLNDDATELQEAAEQQRQITQIRLKKWLAS